MPYKKRMAQDCFRRVFILLIIKAVYAAEVGNYLCLADTGSAENYTADDFV